MEVTYDGPSNATNQTGRPNGVWRNYPMVSCKRSRILNPTVKIQRNYNLLSKKFTIPTYFVKPED